MMTKTKLLYAGAALLLSAGAAAAAPAVSRADLNVRSGPGTEYAVVGVIQAGQTVDVAGCSGSWCQVAFDGGSGFASRSYLQMAAGAPGVGVAVQAPAYDPYDYGYYDYGYSYGPSIGFYSGPRYHRGWRHGWNGRPGGWQHGGRNAGNWRGGDRGNWRGGDRSGPRIGAGMGGPQPGSVDRGGGGARASAPVSMPSAPAASAPAPSAPAAAAPAGNAGGAIQRGR